jgi:hypothetical protein
VVELYGGPEWRLLKEVLRRRQHQADKLLHKSNDIEVVLRSQGEWNGIEATLYDIEAIVKSAEKERNDGSG